MKKISVLSLLFITLLSSQPLLARKTSNQFIHYFNISIYNNTPFNCDLQNAIIISGTVGSITPVPNYLAPGSTNTFVMIESSGGGGAAITLTYQCENSQFSTFVSRSNLTLRNRSNNVTYSVLNQSSNLQANVAATLQNYLKSTSYIYWVFSA